MSVGSPDQQEIKMKRLIGTWHPVALAAALCLNSASGPSHAATHNWDTRPDNGQWSLAGNWAEGAPAPSGTTFLRFGTSALTSLTNDIQDLFWVGGLEFTTTASSYTIGGSALRLADNASIINLNANAIQTFNTGFRPDGNFKVDTAGIVTFAGTIQDALTGASSTLTKTGTGTLLLSADNAYRGQIRVEAGLLDVGHANALKSATLNLVATQAELSLKRLTAGTQVNLPTLSGVGKVNLGLSTLKVGSNQGSTTFGGILSGGGGLTKTGTGTLTLSGANTHTGMTSIQQGQILLDNTDALASSAVSLDGGSLSFGALGTARLGGLRGTGTLDVAANKTLTLNNTGTSTFAGNLTGTGTVVLSGPGKQVLSGTNDFTGMVQISNGTLSLAKVYALASARVQLDSGGVLELGATNHAIAGLSGQGRLTIPNNGALQLDMKTDSTFNGILTGGGKLIKTGFATLTLGGANTHTGNTELWEGQVVLGNTNALASSVVNIATGNGRLSFGGLDTARLGGLTGIGSLTVDAGKTLVLGNTGYDAFQGTLMGKGLVVMAGSGRQILNLTQSSDFAGKVQISSGRLAGASNSLKSAHVQIDKGGTLELAANTTLISGLSGQGDLNIPGAMTLKVTPKKTPEYASSFGGQLSGSGKLVVSGGGQFTLAGDNSFDGMLQTENNSTLVLGHAGAAAHAVYITGSGGGSLVLGGQGDHYLGQCIFQLNQTPGTLDLGSANLLLGANSIWNSAIYGTIAGSGQLIKLGKNKLTLTGINAPSSPTLVAAEGTIVSDGLSRITLKLGAANVVFSDPNEVVVGALEGDGELDLAWRNLGLNGDGNHTYQGATGSLKEIGSITKTGNGTQTFNARLAVRDALTVYSGAVMAGASDTFAGTAVVANVANGLAAAPGVTQLQIGALSGTYDQDLGSTDVVLLGQKSGTFSGLLKTTGEVTLKGASRWEVRKAGFTGTVSLKGGTLDLTSAGDALAQAKVVINSGRLNVNFPTYQETTFKSLQGSGGELNLGTVALTKLNLSSDSRLDTVISGTQKIIKSGTGVLTLGGANTFSGVFSIDAGAVALANDASLRNAHVVTNVDNGLRLSPDSKSTVEIAAIAIGRTLDIGQHTLLLSSPSTDSVIFGQISGTGVLDKAGSGTLRLASKSNPGFTGVIRLTQGQLVMDDGSALSNASLELMTGTGASLWASTGSPAFSFAGLSGNGTLNINSGTLTIDSRHDSTFSGALSASNGTFYKRGEGWLELGGASGFQGRTIIEGGRLVLSNAQALSHSVVTLSTDGGLGGVMFEIAGLEGTGSHTVSQGGTFTLNTAKTSNLKYEGALLGNGILAKRGLGTQTLTHGQAFGGQLVVTEGVLRLEGNSKAKAYIAANSGRLELSGMGQLEAGQSIIIGHPGMATPDAVAVWLESITSGKPGAPGTVPPTVAWTSPSASSLKLVNARLINNGRFEGNILLEQGAVAQGNGEFAGQVAVGSGGTFSPGNSPGLANTGSVQWGAGGTYLVDLLDAQGSAGTGWDLWNVHGTLSVSSDARDGQAFIVKLSTQDLTGAAAPWLGFDASQSQQWVILRATDGIDPFSDGQVKLDATGFSSPLQGGHLGLSVQGKDLLLTFTAATPVPEPETWALALAGLAIAALAKRSKPKH
jgi:fibronectin-binding autotransporter adhesin